MKRILSALFALGVITNVAQAKDIGYSMMIVEVLPFDRSVVLVDLERRMWKVQTLCTGMEVGELVHMVFSQPGSTYPDRIVDPDGKMPQCPVTSYMHIGTMPDPSTQQFQPPQGGRVIQRYER